MFCLSIVCCNFNSNLIFNYSFLHIFFSNTASCLWTILRVWCLSDAEKPVKLSKLMLRTSRVVENQGENLTAHWRGFPHKFSYCDFPSLSNKKKIPFRVHNKNLSLREDKHFRLLLSCRLLLLLLIDVSLLIEAIK